MTITQQELTQFTGTTEYYYLPLFPDYRYTDGVHYLIHNGGAGIVIDIFSLQKHKAIQDYLKTDYFQHWKLQVNMNDEIGTLTCDNDNGKKIMMLEEIYTDFPFPEIRLYLINNVLMLSSEY